MSLPERSVWRFAFGGALVLGAYLGLGYLMWGWDGVKVWSMIAGLVGVVGVGAWMILGDL
jgi:hypothetical protein